MRGLEVILNENLDFIKTKVKNYALPFYRNYLENVLQQYEFVALREFYK